MSLFPAGKLLPARERSRRTTQRSDAAGHIIAMAPPRGRRGGHYATTRSQPESSDSDNDNDNNDNDNDDDCDVPRRSSNRGGGGRASTSTTRTRSNNNLATATNDDDDSVMTNKKTVKATTRKTTGRGHVDNNSDSNFVDNDDDASSARVTTTNQSRTSRKASSNGSRDVNHNNNNNNNNIHSRDAESASILKILLSTDNHLGYCERDPIRSRDSFAAFEEMLMIARQNKVDLVLLSGDLFHENKPSRKTLHTTIEILRRYCMGSEAVNFQIVSDQKECLRSIVSGRANYEDEFYSVDLPIFLIHGNHDDPTRDGGPELLSAVDLLSVANLVNYFGRQDEVDNVRISPVLLQKGETKVALYGMGSMRDERLNRMWQGKRVKFLRPERNDEMGGGEEGEGDEEKDWFNIFTLHQNRDLGRGSKNCVHESMIPEWMDLVVWGHEHECLIQPSESLVGTFRIIQPGSSVATSLTVGEARRKQVGLLEIKGGNFRLTPKTLSSVRSFAVGEVVLSDMTRERGGVLDVEDPNVEDRISELLTDEVNALIQKARDEAEQLRQDAAEEAAAQSRAIEDEFDDSDKPQRKYELKNPEKVLVRLKVEHTGFTTLNNQRFGSKFVGEVANPSDILLFHKRRKAEVASGGKDGASKRKRRNIGLDVPLEPEDLEQINIEDLITANLANNDKKLEILDEKSMGEALEQFVEKKEARGFTVWTEKMLTHNQKILMKRARGDGESGESGVVMDNPASVREFLSNMSEKKREEYQSQRDETTNGGSAGAKKRTSFSGDEDDVDERPPLKKPSAAKGTTKKSRPRQDDYDSDVDMDREAPPAKSTSSISRPSRTTVTKKPRYTYDDSGEEEIDDSEDEVRPKSVARGRKVASTSQPRTSNVRNAPMMLQVESDSDDEPSSHFRRGGAWGNTSQSNIRRGRR